MKKLGLLFLFVLLMIVPFVSTVKADAEREKITVYLFRGEGCPHCAEAEEFFAELNNDEEYSKYYVLKDFEVWNDADNAELMNKVAEKLDTSAGGVPFIVIGTKHFAGYSSRMSDSIKATIKEQYESDSYQDVVSAVRNGTEVTKEESNKVIPIVIISVIAVATVIGLVFLTKEK